MFYFKRSKVLNKSTYSGYSTRNLIHWKKGHKQH